MNDGVWINRSYLKKILGVKLSGIKPYCYAKRELAMLFMRIFKRPKMHLGYKVNIYGDCASSGIGAGDRRCLKPAGCKT